MSIELVLCVKDGKGNKTGHRKSLVCETGAEVWHFWMKHQGKPKRKKKNKVKAELLPKGKDAEKIAETIGKYAEEKQNERDVDVSSE